jgi:hypothetical protein
LKSESYEDNDVQITMQDELIARKSSPRPNHSTLYSALLTVHAYSRGSKKVPVEIVHEVNTAATLVT